MKIEIRLPDLHAGQEEVARSLARFKAVAAGRRWGKSLLGAVLILYKASRGGRCWWVAPSHRMALEGWRYCKSFAREMPDVRVLEGERSIQFPSGGLVEFRTGDEPSSLRGSGLDYLVLDEAVLLKAELWHEVLRPSLSDRRGEALLISTPSGYDWFQTAYNRGLDPAEKEWASFRFPSETSPYWNEGELEELRKTLPDRVYEQEIGARFLEGDGVLFRNITKYCTEALDEKGGSGFYGFVDLAEVTDFNAVSVFRSDGSNVRQVYCDRWNKVEWPVTLSRIANAVKRYRGTWSIDLSGQLYGDRYLNDLREHGAYVDRYIFTSKSKPTLITTFEAMLDCGEVALLDPHASPAAEIQLGELVIFRGVKSGSGFVKYSAPPGSHDDLAISTIAAAVLCKEDQDWDRGAAARAMGTWG